MRGKCPERVPFRLTRMIQNALDGGIHGIFKKKCDDIMWILRNRHCRIIALLEVFINEPTFREMIDIDKKEVFQRVSSKLTGTEFKDGESLNVEEQVENLINVAIDQNEYMNHSLEWFPFW